MGIPSVRGQSRTSAIKRPCGNHRSGFGLTSVDKTEHVKYLFAIIL